ncbi:hypothetical protein [Streptomyces sp. NPDC018031]|uniref:hypothetical protein n=1 Tax=Streptomyces sp. NPDC018031 TaxID=3365033 RepID=UPI00379B34A7
MTAATPPPAPGAPPAPLADVPALAPFARAAVRLDPVPPGAASGAAPDGGGPGPTADGTAPSPYESSLGGPLLWPEDESWPVCREAGRAFLEGHPTAVPMVPVVQLRAEDAPGGWWPPGTDLLQILWCPNDHEGAGHDGPVLDIRWRAAAEVRRPRTAPPPETWCADWDAAYAYRPTACRLTPTPLTDLPYPDELPDEVRAEVDAWSARTGGDYLAFACLPGWKAGGWPTWHLTDYLPNPCHCGAELRLLFTVASSDAPPKVIVGRFGDLRVFRCPEDAAHGFRVDVH